MTITKKLDLFISYSHDDEKHVNELIKHIAPLKSNGLLEDWHDRKILPGEDFEDTIDNNLQRADVVCLIISANFLASKPCMREKDTAFHLKNTNGTSVVPIIVAPCGWLDDADISSLLALPTDGNPITDFQNLDSAWNDVYVGLKRICEKEISLKQIMISEDFNEFLQSTELLSKAHSQKEEVLLDDIFVFPDLAKFDDFREYETKLHSNDVINTLYKYPKLLIAGENQSGKTTLCKKIFLKLRENNYLPVYISDKRSSYHGIIDNLINRAVLKQYSSIKLDDIDEKKIVPILDDFHFASKKEKHIINLAKYSRSVIVVDDIFNLNFKDEQLISTYTHFQIRELSPSLRNQIIEKWVHLSEKEAFPGHNDNDTYGCIDKNTELVNTTLGKIIGDGLMPAYPFFILSVISAYEIFAKPLEQEITSQGYCYQALIYMYLMKQGVSNDDIDIYINFLTELSFFFFSSNNQELSKEEYTIFLDQYLKKYNLPIEQDKLIGNLISTHIVGVDSLGNYTFCYPYLYYYFVAKYLADNISTNKDAIDSIINNLHKDENAYIAIFISHHSKDDYILEEIILNALLLFDRFTPATLNANELGFFDDQVDMIVKAILPPADSTPEQERLKRLEIQDSAEESDRNIKTQTTRDNDSSGDLATELRRSIKTVEVMGRIIKNRAGSLEKDRLEYLFREAMNVHLRILTSFFELIKTESEQEEVIKYISTRIKKIEESKGSKDKPNVFEDKKLDKLSRVIFWNMNFFVIYGFIMKIVHSLGSNKLTPVVEKVCNDQDTPASFIIKHGIHMWYNKNLQIDNIVKEIDKGNLSETTKRVLTFIIANHCSLHLIGYKEKQKIEHSFGISPQKLLMQQANREECE